MARDGLGLFIVSLTVSGLLVVFCIRTYHPVLIILTTIVMLWTFFILYFFRDPERFIPQGANQVVSPADGRILDIREEEESFFFHGKAIRISIFMSPLNVHVNRIPASGTVQYIKYYPGRFLPAYHDKASLENEQMHIGLQSGSNRVFFKQIAGAVARRVVCRLAINDVVERGARFGMIKLGSRVDLFLPPESCVTVRIGEKVSAGSTVIGEFKHES